LQTISGSLFSYPLPTFQVTSGVPQGSVLGPFLFNVFIDGVCNFINYFKFLIFADSVKNFSVINSPHDCLLLRSDINSLSAWCAANSLRLNIAKRRVVSYSRKTNVLSYEYQLCHAAFTRTGSIKDLGVFFDSKLHFHNYVSFILSECIKLLGLILSVWGGPKSLGIFVSSP
jgi:hypothetical protein